MSRDASPSAERIEPSTPTDVILIGCGVPFTSVGAVHLRQLLEEPTISGRAHVVGVVEPFLLAPENAAKAEETGFADFQGRVARDHPDVVFAPSIATLGSRAHAGERPCIAFVATRTLDVPKHIDALIANNAQLGVTHLYLEKPGAIDVPTLKHLKAKLDAAGIATCIGYNKCVAKYTDMALTCAHSSQGPVDVTLVHHNDYASDSLPEVFERCGEGMLKNMACHELSLAVCAFGLRAVDIREKDGAPSVTIDTANSSLETHGGRTDWARLAFTVHLGSRDEPASDDGTDAPSEERGEAPNVRSIKLVEDRCAGDSSAIRIGTDEALPKQFDWPLAEEREAVGSLLKAEPTMRTILAVAYPTYLEAKQRVFAHIESTWRADGCSEVVADGEGGCVTPRSAAWPAGICSLSDALTVLEIIEKLEPMLREQVGVKQPSLNSLTNLSTLSLASTVHNSTPTAT